MRLAVRFSTVLGPMLPVFFMVSCAIIFRATPRYTTARADAARFYAASCAVLYCASTPYITVRADAATFYTVSCAILYCATPPTILHLGHMLPVLVRRASACWVDLYCAAPLHCT